MTTRLPVIAASVCLGLSGCAATTSGTATPADPPPAATVATLPALLLSAPEVGTALGSDDVVVTREVTGPWDDSAQVTVGSDGVGVGCLAIAGAAQRAVYEGTGWTALRGQVLREAPTAPTWSHFATQAVVLFPTAEAAGEFYHRSVTQWAGCADRELGYAQQPAPDQLWRVGTVATDRDMLTVTRTQLSPQQWSCQRALSVRGAVAVDVEACTEGGPTGAAAALTAAIGERLPSA